MKNIFYSVIMLFPFSILAGCNSQNDQQVTKDVSEKADNKSQSKSDYFEGYWVSENNNPSFNIKITKVTQGMYDAKVQMGTMEVPGWSGHWHIDPTLGDKTIVHTDTDNATQEYALTYTDDGKLYNGKFFFSKKN